MTAFTADDLKRLKEIISVNVHAQINESIFDHEFLQAFLARLEAAEAFGEMMCLTYGDDAEKTILYQAWRKAAGKRQSPTTSA